MQTIINNLDVIAFIAFSAAVIGGYLRWNFKAWGPFKKNTQHQQELLDKQGNLICVM
jgi:hypothetical protein